MNLAFLRLSHRQLNFFLLLAALVVGAAAIQAVRYAPDFLFYRTGAFVKYHNYMTPDASSQSELAFVHRALALTLTLIQQIRLSVNTLQ